MVVRLETVGRSFPQQETVITGHYLSRRLISTFMSSFMSLSMSLGRRDPHRQTLSFVSISYFVTV